MKKLLAVAALVTILALAGCSQGQLPLSAGASSESNASASALSSAAASSDAEAERSTSIPADAATVGVEEIESFVINANDKQLEARLADTDAARSLAEQLQAGPVTVSLRAYGGFEKVGPLPWGLPASDEQHPGEHATNAFVPRDWTRGMYFMDDWDPRFGEAFYDGSWMAGIDQQAMLQQIECPVVYRKASTSYGDDGVLYAATTDEDAARIQATVPSCETIEIESGHDIHYEYPVVFAKAIDQAAANGSNFDF